MNPNAITLMLPHGGTFEIPRAGRNGNFVAKPSSVLHSGATCQTPWIPLAAGLSLGVGLAWLWRKLSR